MRCMRLCGVPTTEARLRYVRSAAALACLRGYSRRRSVATAMVHLLEDFMTCGATDRTDVLALEIANVEDYLLTFLQELMCKPV